MNRFSIDGQTIKQPVSCTPQWETTYTEDSGRVMSGIAELDPMFTTESYSIEWDYLSPAEASKILQLIVPTASKASFTMHYFNWYYGSWRDDTFYVGKGSLKVKTLEENNERLDSISFNAIRVNPL